MNDFVRDKLTNNKGEIAFWGEMVAGGCVSTFRRAIIYWTVKYIFKSVVKFKEIKNNENLLVGWWKSGHVY